MKDTRNEKRAGFDMPTRLALAEQDLDSLEGSLGTVVEEQRRGNRFLQGILATLATGAVLLAGDIVLRGFGA